MLKELYRISMVHSIFFRYRVHTSQHMDLCSWVELLENGLIDIMDLIISRTENNAIQKVLVILSSCIANSWIDSVVKSIEISTNHGLRNLNHLIIIHS